MKDLNLLINVMKLYFFSSLLFLLAFIFQIKKDSEVNNIIENGITEKVLILDKTEHCLNSTRNRNKATVETQSGIQFELSINYQDCVRLRKRDSLLIRYLDKNSNALRVYDYNTPTKKNNLPTYVFLLISLAFLGVFIYKFKSRAS